MAEHPEEEANVMAICGFCETLGLLVKDGMIDLQRVYKKQESTFLISESYFVNDYYVKDKL